MGKMESNFEKKTAFALVCGFVENRFLEEGEQTWLLFLQVYVLLGFHFFLWNCGHVYVVGFLSGNADQNTAM